MKATMPVNEEDALVLIEALKEYIRQEIKEEHGRANVEIADTMLSWLRIQFNIYDE